MGRTTGTATTDAAVMSARRRTRRTSRLTAPSDLTEPNARPSVARTRPPRTRATVSASPATTRRLVPSHGFNQQEETVAEWLYNRIMLERHTFYEERGVEVIPWQ